MNKFAYILPTLCAIAFTEWGETYKLLFKRYFLFVFSLAVSLLACQEQKSPKQPISSSSSAVSSSVNSSSSSCIGGISGNILTDSRDCKQYKIIVVNTWYKHGPPDAGIVAWMAENLNYAGDDGNLGVCYNNDPSYCNLYGRLYYWGQAMHACPPGWHLPENYDWARLSDYVHRNTNGGKAEHLRARAGWVTCGISSSYGNKYECSDTFGFAALPGGFAKYSDSGFNFIGAGDRAIWWSATKDKKRKDTTAFITYISNDRYFVAGDSRLSTSNIRNKLSSVRCIKRKEI